MNSLKDANISIVGASSFKGVGNGSENSYLKKQMELQSTMNNLSQMAKDAPVAAKQQTLSSLIKRCEIMNSTLYTAKTWNALMKAYGKGKRISLGDSPSLETLTKVVKELMSALAALEIDEKKQEDDEAKEGLPLILELNSDNGKEAAEAALEAATAAPVEEGSVDVNL